MISNKPNSVSYLDVLARYSTIGTIPVKKINKKKLLAVGYKARIRSYLCSREDHWDSDSNRTIAANTQPCNQLFLIEYES